VQHQKFAWLLKSAILTPQYETYVWLDYGIGHVPGVTVPVIHDFLDQVRPDDLAIPGCWEKDQAVLTEFFPCWRFCGGVMVVPRNRVHKLYKAVKRTVYEHMEAKRNAYWEVNTLAEAEQRGLLPPTRWYYADHNETMFTNYAKDAP
jgi:hypothetical protein